MPKQPNLLFIFGADQHLRKHVWTARASIFGDAYASFDQTIQLCVEHNCNYVDGGDLFDSARPDAESVYVAKQGVSALNKNGLNFYGIPGNHDKSKEHDWIKVIGGLDIQNKETRLNNFYLYGVPFCGNPSELEQFYAKELLPHLSKPSSTIVVGHQLLDVFCKFDAMVNMKANWVPKEIPAVLLGDYHVNIQERHGNTLFAYPGSTSVQALKEASKKYVYLVNEVNGEISLTQHKLVTRDFYYYTLCTEADLVAMFSDLDAKLNTPTIDDEIKKQKYPDIVTPVVSVKISSSINKALDRLKTYIDNKAHVFSSFFDAETPDVTPELKLDLSLDTLVNSYVKDPAAAAFLKAMMNNDPKLQLEQYKKAIGL
jgi:DNA repair exonuclease SbcCD nuclease subunit